jgi:hypothetical protein
MSDVTAPPLAVRLLAEGIGSACLIVAASAPAYVAVQVLAAIIAAPLTRLLFHWDRAPVGDEVATAA